jgi:PmbA protein
MTLKKIQSVLESLPGLSAWEIRQHHIKNFQRFLIFDQIESQRIVEKVNFLVTLYKYNENKGEKILNESTVILSMGDDPRAKLISTLEMASIVENPMFFLPEKGLSYERVETSDPVIKTDPISCLDQIQDDFMEDSLEKIKRSSAEIFVEDKETLFLNSNGLELENSETNVMVEFVLLSEKGSRLESECQGMKKARFYENLKLKEMVQQYAKYARESLTARLPEGGIYPVVFSEESLDNLFHYYCVQTSGPAHYQNWGQLKIGFPVISEVKGELLTLISNPGLFGGLKSEAFDKNGLPLHRVNVIQNNLFQKRMNNKRFADYLKEEATGDFTNIEIETGSRGTKDLLEGPPCYHLLRFSTFEPNSITGAFSGEIRTGYFIKEGKTIPIKGGSVSGIMQEAFKEVFFSQECTQRGNYLGPKSVRIERLTIAGN